MTAYDVLHIIYENGDIGYKKMAKRLNITMEGVRNKIKKQRNWSVDSWVGMLDAMGYKVAVVPKEISKKTPRIFWVTDRESQRETDVADYTSLFSMRKNEEIPQKAFASVAKGKLL